MKLSAIPHSGGEPTHSSPERRAGSVRRTTTHDSLRLEGLRGPVFTTALGRDLLTDERGASIDLGQARIDAVAEYAKGVITALNVSPEADVSALVGVSIFSKFRSAIEKALPGEADSHHVRFQLLDELPAAILGSGRALRVAGLGMGISSEGRSLPVDICSGWAAGGTLLSGYSELGPPLHRGPQAPSFALSGDELAWHDVAVLRPHATRRARRLDIWEEGGRGWADAFFRDSHVNAEGVETITHEWTLRAELDLETRSFASGAARSGPLPYPECPGAGASADRLAGMPFDGLRRAVRGSFVGPSTCTHLNDTFRSMEDVGALLDALHKQRADAC
jgi:hypothetical protein